MVIVTAHADVQNAVEALRAGAWDYLTKPVQPTDLVVKIRKVLDARGLRDRLTLAKGAAARPPLVAPQSAAMGVVVDRLRQLARSRSTPVLLSGPSGAGKQCVAEMLHEMTWRETDPEAPFVEINCAALPEQLVESELFGHERGAFTDARASRRGLVEMADGGSLFLDEVTELPLPLQAKLHKFLDSFRFRRLGGQREIEVKLRVIAATNRDIVESVRSGAFREDLYHRLAVFTLELPPLAARREDIVPLAETFVAYFASRIKTRIRGLSPEALKRLTAYHYPGNIRELRNIVERAVILAEGEEVTERDIMLPGQTIGDTGGPPFFGVAPLPDGTPPPLDQVERLYVERVLAHFEGKRMAAAEALGISYPTFLKRLRELDLD